MMMQQSLIILQKVSSFRSNFISYDIIKASGLPEAFLCVQAWSNAGNRQSKIPGNKKDTAATVS